MATPLVFGWKTMVVVFWYLAYCTFISYATQFTLAYQNRKAERHGELVLRNMTDTMRLLVAMAEDAKRERDEQGEQLDEIQGELEGR